MEWGEFIMISIATCIFFLVFWWQLKRKVARRRSLDMVFLRVIIARKDSDIDEKKETVKDFREHISIMEQLFSGLKSLYTSSFLGWFLGQEYLSFEYVAHENEIYFYVVVPKHSRLLVEKQITGFYPDCTIEETPEVNIFENRPFVAGEIMRLKKGQEYPIRTYQKLETDSMNGILSALGRLSDNTSAVVQLLLLPVDD